MTNKIFDTNLRKVDGGLATSDNVKSMCYFCNSIVEMSSSRFEACKNLGKGRFHCPFCIRHNLHHNDNKNFLILNMKGIIGYYYYCLYASRTLWLSQIIQYIEEHKQIGLANPTFIYDDDKFTWYVDFNRIGKTKHKMLVSEVYRTVADLIDAFDLKTHIPLFNVNMLYEKYQKAIELFYEQRQRPADRKILSPTIKECGGRLEQVDLEGVKEIFPHFFFNSSLTYSSSNIIVGSCKSNNIAEKDRQMKLVVNVKESKTGWTGTVAIPNVSGARLSRKDGETTFPTRSALTTVARSLAKKLGADVEYAETAKKAAKKAPTKKATKAAAPAATQSSCQQTV